MAGTSDENIWYLPLSVGGTVCLNMSIVGLQLLCLCKSVEGLIQVLVLQGPYSPPRSHHLPEHRAVLC
jgi:hypothetical protein